MSRLGDVDRHASWREVYAALSVDPDGHEQAGDRQQNRREYR